MYLDLLKRPKICNGANTTLFFASQRVVLSSFLYSYHLILILALFTRLLKKMHLELFCLSEYM